MTKRFAFFSVAVFLLIASFSVLHSEESKQEESDLYTQSLKNPNAANAQALKNYNLKRWTLGLPAIPLDFLKSGFDPALYYVEDTHLVKKIDWLWKEFKRRGFYPEARFSPTTMGMGAGVRAELDEILKTNQNLPFLKYDALVGYAAGGFFDASTGYKISLPENPAFYHQTRIKYENTPLLNFYGIGSNANRGDRSLYSQEELNIDTRLGYKAYYFMAEPFLRYRHVNIGNGHLEGEFRTKERFNESQVPGINGVNLLDIGTFLSHDTRDADEDPLKGGYEQFDFHYSGDTEGQNFRYLTMNFRAAHFFELWSDRRVFALHLFAGRTQKLGDNEIPFFDLQRIGGYGVQPSGSEMLRSLANNRYMDQTAFVITPEYRYNIWKYGNFSADSVFFADFGEVFKEIHNFGIDRLKPAYGAGIRVKKLRDVFFSFEVAHGNEGTVFYARTKTPF